MSANDRQVAGSHYGGGAHQHWDIVVEHDLNYFEGQITKYVMRCRRKNGKQDLEKAKHFIEKYLEVYDAMQAAPAPVAAQPAQLPPGLEYDLRPSFVIEGYAGDGTALYTCKDCNAQFWGTQQDAIQHLTTHWET